MSWWGSGKNSSAKEEEQLFSEEQDFAMSTAGAGNYGHGQEYNVDEVQQVAAAIQQQLLVNMVITKISHTAFMKCVDKSRDSQLTGREVSCIHAVANKWLESNQYLRGRMVKKAEQSQK